MDYLQINIGGKLRGLKFNQLAYITFYKFIDLENFDSTFHYAAVYAALLANAYVKREEFTETFETVCGWVDEATVEDKNAVLEAFNSTAYWKKIVEDGKAVVEKEKKTTEQKKRKTRSISRSA